MFSPTNIKKYNFKMESTYCYICEPITISICFEGVDFDHSILKKFLHYCTIHSYITMEIHFMYCSGDAL